MNQSAEAVPTRNRFAVIRREHESGYDYFMVVRLLGRKQIAAFETRALADLFISGLCRNGDFRCANRGVYADGHCIVCHNAHADGAR